MPWLSGDLLTKAEDSEALNGSLSRGSFEPSHNNPRRC